MIQTRTVTFVLTVLGILAALPAHGANFYVDGNAAAGGTGGADDPYLTVRDAYDAVETSGGSDTIWVADGTYNDAGENWSGMGEFSLTQSVNVLGGYSGYSGGAGDWTDANRNPRSTVLDLAGSGTRAFSQTTDPSGSQAFTFDGLSFRNASHAGNGGAMLFTETGQWDKTLQINDCLFEDNSASEGGAVYSTFKEGFSINNCDFQDNTATTGDGGGLWFHAERSDSVQQSTFQNNSADAGWGGGIYVQDSANTPIIDSSFFSNSASSGGGVAGNGTGSDANAYTLERVILRGNNASTGAAVYKDLDTMLTLANAEITGNTGGFAVEGRTGRADGRLDSIIHATIADNSGGGISILRHAWWTDGDARVLNNVIASNGAIGLDFSGDADNDFTLEYNDVWGHTTEYSGDATPGTGSMSLDPLFVNPDADDYTLQFGSPALDAGTDLGYTIDLLGDSRPQGGGYAMGTYETPTPEPGGAALLLLGALALISRRGAYDGDYYEKDTGR